MSIKNTGGPAFPQGKDQGASDAGFPIVEITGGMTLRDYFAAAALSGMCGDGIPGRHHQPDNAAKEAYQYADAMLAEREK